MTNETNWPDDAREEAQKALSTAQDTAQDAVRTGQTYLRENPIPVILGALLIGAGMAAAGAPGAGQFLTLGAACAVCGALLWRA